MTICHPVPVKASVGEKTSHPHEEHILQLSFSCMNEFVHILILVISGVFRYIIINFCGLVNICQPLGTAIFSTFATQCTTSLVPRLCAFVACSTKFMQNFVLQATNVQGLGTRLVHNHNWVFKT